MNGPFVRDRFTWLAYGMLAYYAYIQSSLGVIMPFLRDELRLSYTAGGLHVSAFALGMIGAGLTGDRVARRLGRHLTFWGGALGMAGGALLLLLSPAVWLTVPSTFVMGLLGSFLLAMIQSSLADHHGERRAIALTESNVVASIGSGLVPLLVGLLAASGAGWRAALLLPALVVAVALWRFKGDRVPEVSRRSAHISPYRALPPAFWGYFLVIVLAVAIEWSVVVWGADFLENVVGLPKSVAATTIACFFIAQIVGRFVGSRLARTVASDTLLLAALGVTLVGFPIFWLAPFAPLSIVGLAVLGLGVGNLFPMTLTVATTVAEEQADAASARAVLGGGLAILVAPLLLGWAADQLGIRQAYGAVALFILLATVVALLLRRATARPAFPSEARPLAES